MSDKRKIHRFPSMRRLVTRLRDDLNNPTAATQIVLLFAYNRTGKTRLSMEFKQAGKRKSKKNPEGKADTLYFNAFTEDLFTWENDLENDTERGLKVNDSSQFFDGFASAALEPTIDEYLKRYTDFEFDITYTEIQRGDESFFRPSFVSFRKGDQTDIKISRGEQNIFIWCVFMAICEQVLQTYGDDQWVRYLYIDDPISSLDDNNAIAVACDLAKLLRRAASRLDPNGDLAPIKVVFSSHHALFFNVMCNEIGRAKEGEPKVTHKRYFLHRPNSEGVYTLRKTEDTPFFHHIAALAELKQAVDFETGALHDFHFNGLRNIMEKTASFFGQSDISFCLKTLCSPEDQALYNRALNLLSHGEYAIHSPTPMNDEDKNLFLRILSDFLNAFPFDLPDILGAAPVAAPGPTTALTT